MTPPTWIPKLIDCKDHVRAKLGAAAVVRVRLQLIESYPTELAFIWTNQSLPADL